jgi:hypothetical protein
MKLNRIIILALLAGSIFIHCEHNNEDFNGIYCLNLQNLEMTIDQHGDEVTFSLNSDLLNNGTGIISGDTLLLTAFTSGSELFSASLIFANDRMDFTGTFLVTDSSGQTALEGILNGSKGVCIEYDIAAKGIPKFVEKNFTQLFKIEKISKFRSGFGHSYTDGNETCRSMKHYYNPFLSFRENNTVEIYSPVEGIITSVLNDGHGASIGLKNKEIQIRPTDQPAFVFILFHCDILSEVIKSGKKVQAGELLGYGRLYYDDLDQYVTSFDIAVSVNTPAGMKLISYFDTLNEVVFNEYISRGAELRSDFVITREARDASPLQCNGETFLNSGVLENWVTLK